MLNEKESNYLMVTLKEVITTSKFLEESQLRCTNEEINWWKDLNYYLNELKYKINSLTNNEVFIIIKDCLNDETRNVACFDSEKEAQDYCDKLNTARPYRYSYEGWKIGEIDNKEL